MARPLRIEFEEAVYHLCARGNARQGIFRDDRDRIFFLKLLSESAQRFEASVLCFVLMRNHFHLVAQTHRPNLRRWMHWLLVSYTVYFNRRHHLSGHLFQGRYKSFPSQSDLHYLNLLRYIETNPVRAGLVKDAGRWAWSSFAVRQGRESAYFSVSAGVATLACLLFGLLPAFRATRAQPVAAMRAGGRGLTSGRERFALRRALVTAQVAMSRR